MVLPGVQQSMQLQAASKPPRGSRSAQLSRQQTWFMSTLSTASLRHHQLERFLGGKRAQTIPSSAAKPCQKETNLSLRQRILHKTRALCRRPNNNTLLGRCDTSLGRVSNLFLVLPDRAMSFLAVNDISWHTAMEPAAHKDMNYSNDMLPAPDVLSL